MFRSDDTIVAIATPLGEGGLGVIRLSGPDSLSIAEKIFFGKSPWIQAASHTLHHGWIKNGSDTLDEVVLGLFRNPHSYTGEDVVELSCHGSPAVLKEIVKLCESKGARLAGPGEFTQRAYLHGKLDLLQAEAVADLIHAKSTRALNVAANQLQGVLSQQIKLIRDELVRTLSFIEANLDFIEEDIPPLSWKEMETQLSQVKKNLSQFISSSMEGKLLREGIRIVLTGKPNVGKSSLFNALLAHDRAIVTPIPGTTRDTLEESLDWNGFPVVLVDTAGLRHTEDIVESQGTTRAKQASQAADIILIVIDGSSPLDVEDKEILKHGYQGKTLVVVNKSDLPSQITTQEFEQLGISSTVRVSAQTRTGLMDLKKEVQNLVLFSEDENSSVSTVVGLRHLHHLKACLIKVDAALRCILGKKSEEAISLDVKAAIEELDFMTGENVNDDVLNAIFRQFCIGK